jgi:hypothetical protein
VLPGLISGRALVKKKKKKKKKKANNLSSCRNLSSYMTSEVEISTVIVY